MKKIIVTIAIVAVILAGGYFLLKAKNPKSMAENANQQVVDKTQENIANQNNTIGNEIDTKVVVGKKYEIIYADSGYLPASLTIKVGDTVTFKNESSGSMWVGSAMHPSHAVYSGTSLQEHCPDTTNTSFDQCEGVGPGGSWSFTFNKAGTWGQHNHVRANHFSKIIVE